MTEFANYERHPQVESRFGNPDIAAWQRYLEAEKRSNKKNLVIAYHLICATKNKNLEWARQHLNTYTLANYAKNGGSRYIAGAKAKSHYSEENVFGYLYARRWNNKPSKSKTLDLLDLLNTEWAQYVCEKISVPLASVKAYLNERS